VVQSVPNEPQSTGIPVGLRGQNRRRGHSRTGVRDEPTVSSSVDRPLAGIAAVTLLAVAIGVLAKRPPLLLVGALTGAYVAYPRLTATPNPDLSVRREIDPASPADGEWVSVRTTITNEGDSALADVRVVDGPRRCSRSRTDRRDVRRRCSRVVR